VNAALSGLMAALSGAPRLDGALCKGRSQLFDLDAIADDQAAIQRAIGICHRCPALRACKAWSDTMTPAQRPTGVLAGVLVVPPPAKKKRAAA
jgi:hypothetical protein